MGSIFFERYAELCKSVGETPNSVAKIIGASSGSVTAWKNGAEPRNTTLSKIADYFSVSTDYLLGKETEKAPALTKKDERDVAKDLELIMSNLESADGLMFDGNPMSDEARESMRAAIEIGLKTVKILNKETYTPNKHKKG